jgi:hypothetical protein
MLVGFAAQALRRANTRRTSRVSVIFLLVEDAVHSSSEIVDAQCRSRIMQKDPSFHAQKLGDAEQSMNTNAAIPGTPPTQGGCETAWRNATHCTRLLAWGPPAMLG